MAIKKKLDEAGKDLKEALTKAGEDAKNVMNKAGEALKDASDVVEEKANEFAKDFNEKATQVINDAQERLHEAKIEADKARLKPIFTSADIEGYEMVCVSDKDKKRKDAEVCNDSIGHFDEVKNGLKVLNIYKKDIEKFNFEFLPNNNYGFYYASPIEPGKLINLDAYFQYIKDQRVAELHDIAYKIGASFVEISYKEQEKTLVSKTYDFTEKANVKRVVKAEAKEQAAERHKTNSDLAIAYSAHYHDNNPEQPELHFFADDKKIGTLIDAALKGSAQDMHVTIKYNTSTLINKSIAVKIDATLKQYGASGNGSVASEVEKESRTELDFYVEFPKKQ